MSRQLRASVENVWRAYTEKELLEKWWSPAPWRTETKSMNFKVGGFWHYAMVSPEGDKVWSKMSYLKINTHKKIETNDSFCDNLGVANGPSGLGEFTFTKTSIGTNVDFKITYESVESLNQLIEMGFEEGMIQILIQLDELLLSL